MTRITNHSHPATSISSSSSSNLIPASKTIKYRIAIKQPEEWKIRSIAQYKQKQKIQQLKQQRFQQLLEKQPPQREQDHHHNSLDNSLEKKKLNHQAPPPPPSTPSAQSLPVGQTTSNDSKEEKLPKEIEIKNAYESHVRELANGHFTSTVAKARIAALHSVRISLLWLLKKASLHERAMIQDHLQPLNNTN